jgi:hypothetical protein
MCSVGLLGSGRASLVRCEVGVVRAPLASLWAGQKSTLPGSFEVVVHHDQLGGVANGTA